jgi:hypothetical protein
VDRADHWLRQVRKLLDYVCLEIKLRRSLTFTDCSEVMPRRKASPGAADDGIGRLRYVSNVSAKQFKHGGV